MPRKITGKITVGSLENKLEVPPGTIRHPSGRKVKKNAKLSGLRKKAKKQ